MLQNRVREYSTSVGTGTFSLNGRIDATYQDFVSAFGDGNPCFYTIVNMDALEWEIGHGVCHLGSPNTLTRTVVMESSNAGSPVAFSSGLKQVFCGIPQQFFSTSPVAGYVPRANASNKIDNGWLKNTIGYDYFNVITYASSLVIDMNNGAHQFVTLTGNPTLSLANLSANGDVFTIALKQDATGGRTVTWFGGITWPGGSPVQPTATANSISYFDFIRLASGTIYFRQFASGGGGGGGVSGPPSTNVDAVAVWDNTTGTLLRNSLVNIHSSANDKLEYLASFSTIYTLTGADLSGAHSDRLLATSDGGNNTWTSTGANLWSVTNKLVPDSSPGTGNISKGAGSAPILFDFGQVAYTPTNCTVKLWIGTAGSGSTIGARVYQTLPGAVYNQLFHSSTTSIPVSGGAELDLILSPDNPYVPGYDINVVFDNTFTNTVTIWAIELDLSTFGGVMIVDMNKADKFLWTADAGRNFEFDNYSVGQRVILNITQNGTGYNKPTFQNCVIKWNGGHDPYYWTPPNSWVETELLCESIDIYGQPTFRELGRRASSRYDDLNYRIGSVDQDITASTIGLNLDVYLVVDSSVVLPNPTADMYGKKITLINAITPASLTPNGSSCTISGSISANFFETSGTVYGPSSTWVLPGYMDYVTLVAGDPSGGTRWMVIDDGRRGVQSGLTVTATSTVPFGITYVQCNNTSNITLTLPTPPRYATITINSINSGTVTIGSTTLKSGQVGVFIYDGTAWRLLNLYGGTTTPNVSFKTVSASSYTVLDTDQVVLFTYSAGDVAITLSAGSSYTANKKVTLLRGSVSAHNLVISRSGSDTIDGATSKTISGAYTGVTLYNNGSTLWLSETDALPSTVTLQGNTFNGASELVQLDSSGRYPALDGSQITGLPVATSRGNNQYTGSTVTVATNDDLVECTFAGNVTLTLQNSSAYTGNKQVTIINHTAGHTVTISGTSQNFKDFYVTKTSLVLQDGEHITLEWDANAAFWVVLNRRFMAYTTGSGSAALGSNCPAVTATAPYKWVRMTLADESVVYFPVWK